MYQSSRKLVLPIQILFIVILSFIILCVEYFKITSEVCLEIREPSFILQSIALFDSQYFSNDVFRMQNYAAYGPISNIPFFPIVFFSDKIIAARIITFLLNCLSIFFIFLFLKQKFNTAFSLSISLVLYFPITFLSGGIPRGDNVGQLISIYATFYLLTTTVNNKFKPYIFALLLGILLYIKIYYLAVPIAHLILTKDSKLIKRIIPPFLVLLIVFELFYHFTYGSSVLVNLFEFAFQLNKNTGRTISWEWSIAQCKTFVRTFFIFILPPLWINKPFKLFSMIIYCGITLFIMYISTHTGNIHVYYLQTLPVFFVFLYNKENNRLSNLSPLIFIPFSLLFFKYYFNPLAYIKTELNTHAQTKNNENSMLMGSNQLVYLLKNNQPIQAYESYNTQYAITKSTKQYIKFRNSFYHELEKSKILYISPVGLLKDVSNQTITEFNKTNWQYIEKNFICSDTLQDYAPFAGQTFPLYVYSRK